MDTEIVLVFIIAGYLQKHLRKHGFNPALNRQLLIMIAAGAILIATGSAFSRSKTDTGWLSHLLLGYLLYFCYSKKEIKMGKTILYAVAPYLILQVITDLVSLISTSFYDRWHNYFEAAKAFGFFWMVAMWFISRKQRKTLEEERLKAIEKEKEYRVTENLKAALEVQVAERTVALTQQKEELQLTITELKATQAQLVQSEKMASLGELTAGIAHEIQNPLNFVNNFSEVNAELIAEMKEALAKGDLEEAGTIADDIAENEKKINHHGKRADAIVKGMLQHSRSNSGVKEPSDINALADEYLRLAYHGLRAKDKSFNATMKTDFDTNIGEINIVPQEIGRVILNLITNAFYAVTDKKSKLGSTPDQRYEPTVWVSSRKLGNSVEVKVKDNGNGIPQAIQDKIFQPFFTTKPTGQGTGLGLSMSYDIVTKGHGGELSVESREGEGASFIVSLPIKK